MNKELDLLIKAVDLSQKYRELFFHYFCISKKNEEGELKVVYSPNKESENLAFVENWPAKKIKIKNRIAKNKYFSPMGRINDKKEIKSGEQKYLLLLEFFELKPAFDMLCELFEEDMKEFFENGKDIGHLIEKIKQSEKQKQ